MKQVELSAFAGVPPAQRHCIIMALYIQIIVGILVLASFVFAFFSARTWHWGHVLVVLGIFLSTLGFFMLAAETLRINKVLRTQVMQREQQLTQVKLQNDALLKGTDDPSIIAQLRNAEEPAVQIPEDAESIPSLADLNHKLLLARRIRGRVWRNAAPAGADAETGGINVVIESPVPAGLSPDTVVYVFEQGPAELPADDGTPRGKQYLGEFRVTKSAGQQATLVPVLPLDAFEQRRLAASRGPWAIYETMPVDRHAIFAGMSEEELKQSLPRQSVEEYLRHGKEASADDDEARKAGFDENGKRLPPEQLATAAQVLYQRRLRDYATEFEALAQRRIIMEADRETVKKDIERLTTALASAKELQAFRQNELQKLNTDLAGITKERQAIERHLAQVQQQLAKVRELLAETLQRNSQLAEELATRQLQPAAPASGARSPAESTLPLALGVVN